MPLYKTIHHNNNTKIYIWKIEESEESLRATAILNERSTNRLQKMKSTSHIKGFLAVRRLLQEIGLTDHDLYYLDNGKPYLKTGGHISISHSFDFSVIAISDSIIGVDIEMNREKIKRIAHKFVAKEGEYLTEENLVEQLTVIWGAKESLFKIHPDGGLLFREHLPIEEFNIYRKTTTGAILKEPYTETYGIHFEFIDGYTLVYATNEVQG